MRDGQKRDSARALRRSSTDVERRMWGLLRDRRFVGMKFRRQVPVGPYIADFACVARRLVVELDGGQHAESARDERRDAFLAAQGWRVIRFWNSDVVENRSGVLERLLQLLSEVPSP
jgi:very-short-patch-repair endonuclease